MFDFVTSQNISGWSLAGWFVFCWFVGFGIGYLTAYVSRMYYKWR